MSEFHEEKKSRKAPLVITEVEGNVVTCVCGDQREPVDVTALDVPVLHFLAKEGLRAVVRMSVQKIVDPNVAIAKIRTRFADLRAGKFKSVRSTEPKEVSPLTEALSNLLKRTPEDLELNWYPSFFANHCQVRNIKGKDRYFGKKQALVDLAESDMVKAEYDRVVKTRAAKDGKKAKVHIDINAIAA